MDFKEHFFTALQGFGLGAIIMGFVANYNITQLPIALICLVFSIFLRIGDNK